MKEFDNLANANATALMKKAVECAKTGCNFNFAGLLVTAADVNASLLCKWKGPWGKMDWATGDADYSAGASGLAAICPANGGAMSLSGCSFRKNCTKLTLKANMGYGTCSANAMLHKQSCEVDCTEGYQIKQKKFTEDGKKVKDYPKMPTCEDGVLEFEAECEETPDLTPLFIIIGVMSFLLPGLSAIKYFKEVAAFNKLKSEGCTWNGKGELIDASGEKMVENPIAKDEGSD